MGDNKLYDILGVSKNSSDNDIKKQYRKLAKEYHPDKNPAAGDKFKEISFAYEILSNPSKKEHYDRYGLKGLQEGGDGGGADELFSNFFGGGGGPFGGGGGGPFGGLFGGMGMRMGGRRGPRKGESTVHKLKVSLEDMYNGKVSKLQLSKNIICADCSGRGGRAGALQPCSVCNGRGIKVTITQLGPGMVQQMQSRCNACEGEGEMMADRDRCTACNGRKVTQTSKLLEVHIQKGMKDEQKITFAGEGDQQPGIESGDVIIVLQEKPHDSFKRKGMDLFLVREITLAEALCGFTMVVTHLDGRSLVVKQPPGSILQPGAIRCIPDEGMPCYKQPMDHGDLIVKFDVLFPDKYFAKHDKLIELERLLGSERSVGQIPDECEEVDMQEYDESMKSNANNTAEDDDEEGGHAGSHVQCAQQ